MRRGVYPFFSSHSPKENEPGGWNRLPSAKGAAAALVASSMVSITDA